MDISLSDCGHMQRQCLDELVADFHAGAAHLEAVLTVKFAFWGQLPWSLCGLAHGDPKVAQDRAAHCLSDYDRSPSADTQHRVARSFFGNTQHQGSKWRNLPQEDL